MFNRILILLDGSSLAECVLPHALALARANHPQFILLRLIDPLDTETRPRTVDPLDWNFRKVEAETYLADIAARLVKAGLSVTTLVKEGKVVKTVIECAHLNQVDLILLSSHGKSGITGSNLSSVVQNIILRIRTSIMLIRAYQPRPDVEEIRYKHILLPLDGSLRAESVLQIATELSRSHNTEVMAVHVIQKPEIPRRRPLSHEESQLGEEIVERNRVEAAGYLADLKNRLEIPLSTQLLVSEHVASTLHRVVEDSQPDLVILTAHGFSGEASWPYGSVVTTFIAYGTTPLLVYQDLAFENFKQTPAELAAQEHGEH
jgi:nucleotide-binding universal stress UspA family protein